MKKKKVRQMANSRKSKEVESTKKGIVYVVSEKVPGNFISFLEVCGKWII